MKLIVAIILSCLCQASYAQMFVNPLAIVQEENRLVYSMNDDKEIVPSGLPYTYKREAIRKNKRRPFDVTDFYFSGEVAMKTKMKNPDPVSKTYEGYYLSFYENGDTNLYVNYKRLIPDGDFISYYENGAIKEKGSFEEGNRSGVWMSYYADGLVQDSGYYLRGSRNGRFKTYSENGRVSSDGVYLMDKKVGKWSFYYKTGEVMNVSVFKDDKLQGLYESFYASGEKKEIGNYLEGQKNGEWRTFLKNTDVQTIRTYKNGALDGDYLIRSDKGDTLSKGEMSMDNFSGVTHFYNELGDLIIQKEFHNGEPLKAAYYRKNSTLRLLEKASPKGMMAICYDNENKVIECPQQATFSPSAFEDLEKKIAQHLNYQKFENYSPRGVYAFTVDSLGYPINISVTESANKNYDEIAVKELTSVKWNPGKVAGMAAAYSNHLVVHFGPEPKVHFGAFYLSESRQYSQLIGYDPAVDVENKNSSYASGSNDLVNYMKDKTEYPQEAKDAGIKGICVVQFAVEPSGVLSGIELVSSIHPLLDYESIRLVEEMPNWNPGFKDGEKIKAINQLPIRFTLN